MGARGVDFVREGARALLYLGAVLGLGLGAGCVSCGIGGRRFIGGCWWIGRWMGLECWVEVYDEERGCWVKGGWAASC